MTTFANALNVPSYAGGVLYGTSEGFDSTPSGLNGQLLQYDLSGGTPIWTTAAYPTVTTASQLLYSSATNTVSGLAIGNYGVLISSSSGVPSWLANGTTGQVLTATTSGIPSWAAGLTAITINTIPFSTSGTYTPSVGMQYCIIECMAGGGGGGGSQSCTTAQAACSSGGGGGSYARLTASAATIGVSQTVTVGSGGAGGVYGVSNPGDGGTSQVGTLCIALGGAPGINSSNAAIAFTLGGQGGSAITGDVITYGNAGGGSQGIGTSGVGFGGYGGGSIWGGNNVGVGQNTAGNPGNYYGGGGGGACVIGVFGALNGGDGAPGLVVITEFI